MMKPIAVLAAAAALSACASAPAAPDASSTPAQLIVGTWECSANADGLAVKGPVTYKADGTNSTSGTVSADMNGSTIEIVGSGAGVWKLLPDGKIEEMLTSFKVEAAKAGGQALPVEMLQPMVDQMVVNQASVSTVAVTATTLTLTDQDGLATNCTR